MKTTHITPNNNKTFIVIFSEIWTYRYLIFTFSMRDLSVKYFQTFLGPIWLILSPLITVGIMTFVFGLMIRIPSDGLPYLLFYLIAIVSWYAFSNLLNYTMSSMEGNLSLINKVYFPRLVLPLSYGVNVGIDYLVGYFTCIIVCIFYGLNFLGFVVIAPLLFIIQIMWAMGLGLWLAPINAKYRDVKHVVPLFLQIYYFANPILYPTSIAPDWAKWIYDLNPLATCITILRNSISGGTIEYFPILVSLILSVVVFYSGVKNFEAHASKSTDIL